MSRFEINASKPILLRRERVMLTGCHAPMRLLYASDLHFSRGTRSQRVAGQLLEAVKVSQPQVVLFGGDLVDSQQGLGLLENTVRRLSEFCPVSAIPGNHDHYTGVYAVKAVIRSGGGRWLLDASCQMGSVQFDGSIGNGTGSSIVKVLCAHDPSIFPKAVAAGYALVLAGHLHGCQFVFWQQREQLYPGAYVFRWNGLRFHCDRTTMLVSRGLSDLLPIRWNCPREVLLCEIC